MKYEIDTVNHLSAPGRQNWPQVSSSPARQSFLRSKHPGGPHAKETPQGLSAEHRGNGIQWDKVEIGYKTPGELGVLGSAELYTA